MSALIVVDGMPKGNYVPFKSLLYTIEDLKRHVFNLQRSGIGNDLKPHPYGVRF